MDKLDARHLPIETQNYLRQQAIRLRREGKRVCDISTYLGVHPNTVYKWWDQYIDEGEAALYQRKRGREFGEGRTLSLSEETMVAATIREHCPEDYGIESTRWTRKAVRALIEQLCEVKMPIRTVGEYLNRWGYSPQKTVQRAYEQDPKTVERWLNEIYPAIEKRATAEKAEIQWGNAWGLRSDKYRGRCYSLIGHTPEIRPVAYAAS